MCEFFSEKGKKVNFVSSFHMFLIHCMYKYLKILSNFILVMLFSAIMTKYLGQSETTRSATPNILRKDLLAEFLFILRHIGARQSQRQLRLFSY